MKKEKLFRPKKNENNKYEVPGTGNCQSII